MTPADQVDWEIRKLKEPGLSSLQFHEYYGFVTTLQRVLYSPP